MADEALDAMLRRLYVIDFETEAIDGPTSHRPPKPVGMAVRHPHGGQHYYAWGHPSGNNCSWREAQEVLRQIVDTRGVMLGFHHAAFDLAVAETWMNVSFPTDMMAVHDSLILAYLESPLAPSLSLKPLAQSILNIPPDEQDAVRQWLIDAGIVTVNNKGWGAYISKVPANVVGPYAIGDVSRTFLLIKHLLPHVIRRGMGAAYDRERRLVPVLHKMTKRGVRIDRDLLVAHYVKTSEWLEKADCWIKTSLGAGELNIDSNAELADALDKAGKVKHWGMTPSGKRKTSRDALIAGLNDPELAHMLAYRGQLSTVVGTFMEPWVNYAHGDGRIHPGWNPIRSDHGTGTRTGRLSSHDPNFQNIIGDSRLVPPEGFPPVPNMRQYVLPEEGHVFISADFNSQEIRVLGHFAEGGIKKIYDADPAADVHTEVQKLINSRYGIDLPRKDIKIIIFSLIYGAGTTSIAQKLGVTMREASQFIDMIYKLLPGVRSIKEDIQGIGQRGQHITTWGGRQLFAPFDDNGNRRGYALLNYLIQGSAADQTKQAMVDYDEDAGNDAAPLLASVHDELCISAPRGRHLASSIKLMAAMTAGKFDVPMRVEIKHGETWSTVK